MLQVSWAAAEKEDGWETLPLLYKLMPYATVWMAVLTPLCDPPGVTQFDFTALSVGMLLLSGVAAFLVNWSGNQVAPDLLGVLGCDACPRRVAMRSVA